LRRSTRFPIPKARHRVLLVRVQKPPWGHPVRTVIAWVLRKGQSQNPRASPTNFHVQLLGHHHLVGERAYLASKNVALSNLVDILSVWGRVLGLEVGEERSAASGCEVQQWCSECQWNCGERSADRASRSRSAKANRRALVLRTALVQLEHILQSCRLVPELQA
jgi:hypothetical protein